MSQLLQPCQRFQSIAVTRNLAAKSKGQSAFLVQVAGISLDSKLDDHDIAHQHDESVI
jgi:hypothetical protein